MTDKQAIFLVFAAWFFAAQLSGSTRRLSVRDAREIVKRINYEEFGGWFNEGDVLAVIEIESHFDPDAWRYEEHLKEASIGLMQLLLSTARDRGLVGGPAALFDPVTNIRLGMRQLKWSWDYLSRRMGTDPDIETWVGSYNGGVGAALAGRVPQRYVEKWKSARSKY